MRTILKWLMDREGDNAYSVSRKSGVTQSITHRFLTGKMNDPSANTVRAWARLYGITESQFRGDMPIDGIEVPSEPKELKDILPPEEYKLVSYIKKMDPKARCAVFELFEILANKPDNASSNPPVTERRKSVVSEKNQHLRAGEMHYSPPRPNRIKEPYVATARQAG